MDSSFRKIFVAMLCIVLVATFAVFFLYVRSVNKDDRVEENTTEIVNIDETADVGGQKSEEIIAPTKPAEAVETSSDPVDNPIKSGYEDGKHLLTTENVRSIVLRSKDETIGNFRFEMFIDGKGNVTFTGWYAGTQAEVRCSDQPINASRIDDVSDIIERHTVVKQVETYMNDPDGYKPEGGDLSGLEITFADGHHADFGFPNGAGKEMAKYFKNLTDWLSTVENK